MRAAQKPDAQTTGRARRRSASLLPDCNEGVTRGETACVRGGGAGGAYGLGFQARLQLQRGALPLCTLQQAALLCGVRCEPLVFRVELGLWHASL